MTFYHKTRKASAVTVSVTVSATAWTVLLTLTALLVFVPNNNNYFYNNNGVIVVESMVVTTSSKPSRRLATTATTSPADPNSEQVIRMLLEGQGGRTRSSSWEQQAQGRTAVAPSNSSQTTQTQTQTQTQTTKKTSDLLDEWRDYEPLRETNLEDDVLRPFFLESGWKRKQLVAQRFATVLSTLYKAQADWKASRERKQQREEDAASGSGDASATAAAEDEAAAVQLCEAVASLGPLAVKLGQTLSQRPDMVGKDACLALKRLQTQTAPFDNALAMAIIRESLDYWDGPLAANLDGNNDDGDGDDDHDNQRQHGTTNNNNNNNKPLFQHLSPEPIASASLGQVYKATTWDGVDLALKVQRPDALATLAIDTQCFRIAGTMRNTLIDWTEQWNLNGDNNNSNNDDDNTPHSLETGMTEEEVRAMGPEGTVASVIDRVATDIQKELDYRVEAANSDKFRKSLDFLGFVDTPDVVLATPRVMATKFVDGAHLDALEPNQQLALTRMAVEACTASMVLTGFVHADPHEGNMLFRFDDRKLVFLDFGLMSDVDRDVMEAFARGIQALLATNFGAVTDAFSDTGFITRPIMHRHNTAELWKVDPDYGHAELAADLETHMTTTEGGLTRFGALATVLNKKISPNWLVFTPPYVLLLIRTFLTLEGIAAQVDPDFNIYEMSMPWVVRRSLSPATEKGEEVLRSTILKPDNTVQWERILELLALQQEASKAATEAETEASSESSSAAAKTTTTTATETPPEIAAMAATATGSAKIVTPAVAAATTPEEKERKQREYAKARQGAMKDAVGTLLGSTEGKALRGVLRDMDTPDLLWKLGSREGRPIVRLGTERFLNKHIFSVLRNRRTSGTAKTNAKTVPSSPPPSAATTTEKQQDAADYRPMSDECRALQEKQTKRTKQFTRFLLASHLRRCLFRAKGIAGMVRLAASTLQIALSILLRRTLHWARGGSSDCNTLWVEFE